MSSSKQEETQTKKNYGAVRTTSDEEADATSVSKYDHFNPDEERYLPGDNKHKPPMTCGRFAAIVGPILGFLFLLALISYWCSKSFGHHWNFYDYPENHHDVKSSNANNRPPLTPPDNNDPNRDPRDRQFIPQPPHPDTFYDKNHDDDDWKQH